MGFESFDSIILFLLGALGMLTIINVSILLAGMKRDWNGIWFWFVVVPAYFIIVELSHGNQFWDLFYNPAWTLPLVLIAFIIVFPLLGFKFPISNKGLLLAIILYFIFAQYNLFYSNLLGITLFMIIGPIGFTYAAIHTLKYIFSDKA